MDESELEDIVERTRRSMDCDFLDCCEYGKYASCYNHSHAICKNYEVYWETVKHMRPKGL